jgi:hypothetical protein
LKRAGGSLLWGAVAVLGLAACQSPDVRQLQAHNEALAGELAAAQRSIESLQLRGQQLQSDNTELRRVLGLLEHEKSVRVEESTTLRGQVRGFIQGEMDDLRQFLLQSDLLDYIGGELVTRPALDDEPTVLVDLGNPMPRAGTLTGVGGQFQRTGEFQVLVLRPLEKGWLVVWRSQPLTVAEMGPRRLEFSVSVGVEAGDVIAYRFPKLGLVPYDSGTGDTRYRRRNDLVMGESLAESQLEGARERRAYSIGVFGLLNPPAGGDG